MPNTPDCARLQQASTGVAGPVLCVIMDGIGTGPGDEADAVARARTPNLDRYAKGPLSTQLCAHGTAVGMPSDNDMGNSEVGHNAIGAGRIFAQGARLVAEAIDSGELFRGSTWSQLGAHLNTSGGALHLMGLLSDGNVHSHIDHVIAMLRRAHAQGLPTVYLHILLDGRDVPKTSALDYVDRLDACLSDLDGNGRRYRIASGGGRMLTTMDRYQSDWSIVERGWRAHVLGEGQGFSSARQAIGAFREEEPGITDQELPAFVIIDDGRPVGPIVDGDAVIAFNFRGDRMLQICAAFEEDDFPHFSRERRPEVFFAGMSLYDGDTQTPKHFLVSPPEIRCTLGELLCDAGVTQLACSETQKFGHVTYFWNGNRSGVFDAKLETYIEIPSNRPPFDARPEMKAQEIAETTLKELATEKYRFARINLANGDMVGHTGNFDATVAAVEAVDRVLGILEEAVIGAGGAMLVTADHGNAEDMAERDKNTGEPKRDAAGRMVPKTAHSLCPVPLHVLTTEADAQRFVLNATPAPGLGNIASTCAVLLGFAAPQGFLPPLIRLS